jgi:hypothetical protein
MANAFKKPIVLDSVMAQDFLTTIGALNKPLLVDKIRWINPGAAGAGTFLITDASSSANQLEKGKAPAASLNVDQEIVYDTPRTWKNFQLTTFTGGGQLEIHYH